MYSVKGWWGRDGQSRGGGVVGMGKVGEMEEQRRGTTSWGIGNRSRENGLIL